jgi:hypothetical protein
LPSDTLTFSLQAGAPAGASITAGGVFTWTPLESQGPSTNTIGVRVSDAAGASDSRTFVVVVNEVNSSPSFTAIPDGSVNERDVYSYSAKATDPDLPANTLVFSLVSGPPGMTVSGAGLINWNVPNGWLPSTNSISVAVQDNGSPQISVTNIFKVVVNHFPVPASPVVTRYKGANAKILLSALPGADPDGDALTVTIDPFSGIGLPCWSDGTWVYYDADPGLPYDDAVLYIVEDGRGASADGTISISVQPDTNAAAAVSSTFLGGNTYRVRFFGVPGYSYRVEFSPSLTTPAWQFLRN